ncbi:hypothetical protein LRP88_13376 [Fusarium phalaenopsidis]
MAAGTQIKYLPGMTQKKAEIQCIHLYDQAEIMRIDTYNKNVLVTLARMRIVEFSENGDPEDMPAPVVNPDHLIHDRLAQRKYVKQHLIKDTVEHLERFTGVFGDNWEEKLFARVFGGSSKELPCANPSSS